METRSLGDNLLPKAAVNQRRATGTELAPPEGTGSRSPSPNGLELALVSVVIPVWNDRARLETCLEALERQDYPAERMEVIVVDNGSGDEPAVLGARFPRVRFVEEATLGSYNARNRGIVLARGEILAFTDADCIPAANWITNGVRRLGEMSRIGFVAGSVVVAPRVAAHPSLVELYDIVLSFPQEDYVRKSHFGVTGNLFTAVEVFREVGWFDGRLNSGGDVEWGRRVFASGRQVAYAPEVQVAHPARQSLVGLIQRTRRNAAGMLQVERDRPVRVLADQLKFLFPRPRLVWRILTSRKVRGPWSRGLLIAMHLGLRQVSFWERVRVLLGGHPLR